MDFLVANICTCFLHHFVFLRRMTIVYSATKYVNLLYCIRYCLRLYEWPLCQTKDARYYTDEHNAIPTSFPLLLVGTGFHEQCCYVSTSERSNDDAMKN